MRRRSVGRPAGVRPPSDEHGRAPADAALLCGSGDELRGHESAGTASARFAALHLSGRAQGRLWSGDNIWPCVRVSKVPRDQTTFLSLSTFVGGIRT